VLIRERCCLRLFCSSRNKQADDYCQLYANSDSGLYIALAFANLDSAPTPDTISLDELKKKANLKQRILQQSKVLWVDDHPSNNEPERKTFKEWLNSNKGTKSDMGICWQHHGQNRRSESAIINEKHEAVKPGLPSLRCARLLA
jgi:hypothetical protein